METKDLSLHVSRNYVKMGASIAQVFFSVYNIYHARSNQLEQYEYAAYGLSVSLLNAICVGWIGDFTCAYVLRTPVLEEAERREGAKFVGALGKVVPLWWALRATEGP